MNPFDLITLTEAVRNIPAPRNLFIETIFKQGKMHSAETINIFEMSYELTKAPFALRGEEAKYVSRINYQSKFIKPPCIRIKDIFKANDLLKASINQASIYIGQSPAQKLALDINDQLEKMKRQVFVTIEWMCAQAFSEGKITYSADGVEELIDYSLPSANKITVATKWDQNGSSPLKDIEALGDKLSISASGYPNFAIFGKDAWEAFINHDKVQKLYSSLNLNFGRIQPDPSIGLMGQLMGIDLYRYSRTDELGNGFMNSKKVILSNKLQNEFRIDYGVVADVDTAGGNLVTDFFSKSWVMPDPSARMILVESNPLPLIKDIKGVGVLTVLS